MPKVFSIILAIGSLTIHHLYLYPDIANTKQQLNSLILSWLLGALQTLCPQVSMEKTTTFQVRNLWLTEVKNFLCSQLGTWGHF